MNTIENYAKGNTVGLHDPVRAPYETQGQYRERRARSAAAGRTVRVPHDRHRRGTYADQGRQIHKSAIAAAGGVRQYKRKRADLQHDLGRY